MAMIKSAAKAPLLAFLSVLLSSCVSGPPIETKSTPETFFEPYHEAFAKVGGNPERQLVHLGLPTQTNIVIWYLSERRAAGTRELSVKVDGEPVESSRIRSYHNKTHNTGRIEVSGLEPGQSYRIDVSGTGFEARDLMATTAPSTENAAFSFLFGSCFEPYRHDDPNGTSIAASSRASLANLKSRAEVGALNGGPSFFLGLGDQIYVDAGAGLCDRSPTAYLFGWKSHKLRGRLGEVPQYLNQLYRFYFGIPDFDSAMKAVPSAMMWDDHDIRDGWGSQGDEKDPGWTNYYQHAREAFVAFQASRNPNFQSIGQAGSWEPDTQHGSQELYFDFEYGPATFFVADYRSTGTKKQGLSTNQLAAIETWLNKKASYQPMVFVFCFPVPVAANISYPFLAAQRLPTPGKDDAHDRIHREDRKNLLERFVKHFRDNPKHKLLILSGDVHYSGLQSIQDRGLTLGYEIISSGIAQTGFNTYGGYYGTVSGDVRNLSSSLLDDLWIQDHGMYSGPSFAEAFIAPPNTENEAPEVRLMFFPAVLRNKAVLLKSNDLSIKTARLISKYPENEEIHGGWSCFWSLFGRQSTKNALPDTLDAIWPPDRAEPFPTD